MRLDTDSMFWIQMMSLTHNAFLWRGGDDVADVKVLWGQFTVQTQEITETAFDGEVFIFKQSHGGLGERHREREREKQKKKNKGV